MRRTVSFTPHQDYRLVLRSKLRGDVTIRFAQDFIIKLGVVNLRQVLPVLKYEIGKLWPKLYTKA